MKKYFTFLIVGLPSFLLAVPLNFLLVDKLQFAKPSAYAIVLLIQVTANYFLCKIYVFESRSSRSQLRQYFSFLAGIAGFRVIDWALYSVVTSVTELYYLYVQLGNVLVLSFAKFFYSKRLFEPKHS